MTESYSSASPEQKKKAIALAIQREVMGGYRVESQTDETAVLAKGKAGTNHILHLILTLLTCGAWGIVWLILAFVIKEKRVMIQVDDYGNILRQQA